MWLNFIFLLSISHLQTYIGHILLLVNPNKELPIYSTLVSITVVIWTHRLLEPRSRHPCIKHARLHLKGCILRAASYYK